jgi:septal ring factor EnvC (AmiA/AmiB activator)
LDATTLGALLAFAGVLSGSVVAYLGKRGENATARFNSEIDQIQEERDGLRKELAERETRITALLEQRVTDQTAIARLRVKIINLGGDP